MSIDERKFDEIHCKIGESILMAQFVLKTQGNIQSNSEMTNTNQKHSPVKSGWIHERENNWVSGIKIIYLNNDN